MLPYLNQGVRVIDFHIKNNQGVRVIDFNQGNQGVRVVDFR